jgi:hypothetical protein
MAFRLEVLRRFPFDGNVGHSGEEVMGGDEVGLFSQLRRQGYVGLWVGPARVRHYIPAERLTLDYVWRRARGCGKAYLRSPATRPPVDFPGRRFYNRVRYWEARLRSICLSPFKGPAWTRAYVQAAFLDGFTEEWNRRGRARAA